MGSIQRVAQDELRRIFAEAQVEQRWADGELIGIIDADREISRSFLPEGTRSQIIHLYERQGKGIGPKIAIIHRYVCPDGTLGASGMPDPKMVRHGEILYRLLPATDLTST